MTQISSRSARLKKRVIGYGALFGSVGTLLCCALPALLASLGLGAVMASLASNFSGLVWVSEHKAGMFIFSGAMLGLNGLLMWSNRNSPCPIDPDLRDSCLKERCSSRVIYAVSLLLFAVGAFFAFVAPKVF